MDSINNGLYLTFAVFKSGVSYKDQATVLSPANGYAYHWDSIAQAPYLYNADKHYFVSYDDTMSIRLKTTYALDRRLGGVMFWQLAEDRTHDGLLDVIDRTKKDWLRDPKKLGANKKVPIAPGRDRHKSYLSRTKDPVCVNWPDKISRLHCQNNFG